MYNGIYQYINMEQTRPSRVRETANILLWCTPIQTIGERWVYNLSSEQDILGDIIISVLDAKTLKLLGVHFYLMYQFY